MSSGLQLPGAPSYASRLRGETPPHKASGIGKAGHLPNTPSNLGMYSQAHSKTQQAITADRRLPNDASWKEKSVSTVQTKSRLPENDSWKPDAAKTPQTSSKEDFRPSPDGQQGIVDSMASLSINLPRKGEPVGRCLDWERPVFTSSRNSKVYNRPPKSERDCPKPTPSVYSISYKRRNNQTPMEQATYREYLPFLKSEFKVGMVIRMNIHESDFKGTSKAAIAHASQASTLVDGGRGDKRRKEHRHHGDFGPIYSENRIFIVVNVAEDVFMAIPLFTHEGKGLGKILDKKSWISVADHRYRAQCVQQSEYQPLCTAVLNPECDRLDPVSVAWIPYALPCRYDVPVAYQGRLDTASAKRLVKLHRQTWVYDESDTE